MREEELRPLAVRLLQRNVHPQDLTKYLVRELARKLGANTYDAICAQASWFASWAVDHGLTKQAVNKFLT